MQEKITTPDGDLASGNFWKYFQTPYANVKLPVGPDLRMQNAWLLQYTLEGINARNPTPRESPRRYGNLSRSQDYTDTEPAVEDEGLGRQQQQQQDETEEVVGDDAAPSMGEQLLEVRKYLGGCQG